MQIMDRNARDSTDLYRIGFIRKYRMRIRIAAIVAATCGLGSFTCNGIGLLLRNIDGSERYVELADRLAITVEEENLVVHSPDGRMECELPALHGFRYVENVSTGMTEAADECTVSVGRDCIIVFSGGSAAECRIVDMSGADVFCKSIDGRERIPFALFQKGIYAVMVDGRMLMKFAVK